MEISLSMASQSEALEQRPAGRWVSYRPEIKVLDCTIRDGGLMNNHAFSMELVRAVYQACNAAGVDYMEVGYKSTREIFTDSTKHGLWRFCCEDDLRRMVGDQPGTTKISVMADAERTNYRDDILPADQSVIDMIRVATYIHQIPVALDMIKDAQDKGYETCLNIMAVSTVQERELDEALELAAQARADAIYLVDSFGFYYSEQIQYLTRKYLHYARPAGMQVGIHAHNNQQLAYANSIEAIIAGANMVDVSMAGLGRGAGNCAMELILGFLHNPKFRLRPVIECIQNYIEPLRAELGWGFDIPYMLVGQMNQHPRAAIAHNSSADRDNLVKFFDTVITAE